MTRRLAIPIAVGALLVAAAVGGGAWAVAGGGDDGGSVTAAEKQRATAAALRATGGGRANEIERDGEKGATFEVEVTKPSGETVDVRLDASYRVVAIDGDSESPDDDGSGD